MSRRAHHEQDNNQGYLKKPFIEDVQTNNAGPQLIRIIG